MEKEEQFAKLAEAVAGMTEFEWSVAKGRVDWLFGKKASKLQLERQEVEKILKMEFRFHQRFLFEKESWS